MIAAAAFTLTNCNKVEIEEPVVEGQTFTLFASADATKTVNEGLSTKWAADDALNVFHAAAGTSTYGTNDKFTVADVADGRFEGTLTEELAASNDWYAIYPYNNKVVTPAATTAGYLTVGAKSQKQQGNDSKAHLAGSNVPLYAVAKGVAASETPTLTMHQLCSIIEVKVKNSLNEPLKVSTIDFTGTEDICGTYYIDITGAAPVYTPSGDNYVSSTVSLSVSGSEAIAAGASASFYIAIKPFSANSGSLKLNVNGFEKSLEITSAVTFTAGKIKTINFDFNQKPADFVTFDLSIDETTTATADEISWVNDVVTVKDVKANSTTNTNNYYPGTSGKSYTSTRFYKNSVLTITPADGYSIEQVVFVATTADYASVFASSTWTNASTSVNEATVTITPADNTESISTVIGGNCGFTSIKVFYATAAPVVKYAVNIADGITHGTVATDVTTAKEGQTVTITATPATGYKVKSVSAKMASGAAVTVNNNKFTMPAEAVIVSAEFEEDGGGDSWTAATMTSGTNGSSVTVNDKEAIKVGTSNKGGDMLIKVAKGATKVRFYAAAWNGVTNLSLNITPTDNVKTTSIALSADTGIAGSSPFTLIGSESNFLFEIELKDIAAETTLTLTSSIAKRFVVWGAEYCK